MNLGQSQRFPQHPQLPMALQYDGIRAMTPEPNDQMHSLDGLPRLTTGNLFFNPWPSTMNGYGTTASLIAAQSTTDWANTAYTSPIFDDASLGQDNGYYYQPPPAFPKASPSDNISMGQTFHGIPRTWHLTRDEPMALERTSFETDTYPLSPYPRGRTSDEESGFTPIEPSTIFDTHDSSSGFPQLSESRSPRLESETQCTAYPALECEAEGATHQRVQLSEGSDDSGCSSREMTAVEFDELGPDEPYAKLIYRALMSAPNHSMVLQEIYQWFRDNTTKGSSDSKGWMNSIRHNLSMNAAFKKSERKTSDDEARKSTEWVLEGFAIRGGVQSTTRYRKGTGNKKVIRSDHTAPARQTSGRKGGICASKGKLQRKKNKEDREDRRSTPRIRRVQMHRDSWAMVQRQTTPLTPPNLENISSPYVVPKSEPLDLQYDDFYRLEDVQGVYSDDRSPLFCNSQVSLLIGKNGLAAHQQ